MNRKIIYTLFVSLSAISILLLYGLFFTPPYQWIPHFMFWVLFLVYLILFIKNRSNLRLVSKVIILAFIPVYVILGALRSTGFLRMVITDNYYHHDDAFILDSSIPNNNDPVILSCMENKIYIYSFSNSFARTRHSSFNLKKKGMPLLTRKLTVYHMGFRSHHNCHCEYSNDTLNIFRDKQHVISIDTKNWKEISRFETVN